MPRPLRGALLIVAAFVIPLVAVACNGDDSTTQSTTLAFDTIETSTTVVGVTTTTVPNISYTVVTGDALTRIADAFCTSAAEIAVLNGWRDGLQHVILPRQTILIPGPGCPAAATTSTTIVMNKYLALYVNEHVVTDPFDPNAADHVNWGPVCYSAYWAAQAFATQGATKATLLAALDPLPGSVPATVNTQIDAWVPFVAKWYPVYQRVTSRIGAEHPKYPNTGNYYRALFSDPEYLTLLQAYEGLRDVQFAAKYYVSDLCTNLLNTKNSTP
ncbi:MAG: LysM peptidoglycan-binding domain-containing protein [Actinomycetota bacterium]